MTKVMKNKVVFDGRNLYDPEKMKSLGFYYASIGRQVVDPSPKAKKNTPKNINA